MITLQQLNEFKPLSVFASGLIENSEQGILMTNHRIGDKLLWVAKRGVINDWAIYVHWEEKGIEFVKTNGDKVSTKSFIKKLVPCNDEAFSRYRF